MKKAIILNSGGLDSATTLALAKDEGFELYSLTIDYGQRHRVELVSADSVARSLGVKKHRQIPLDISSIATSSLTTGLEVPKNRDIENLPPGIPDTYVPARNIIFLSLALAWADVIGAHDIFIGVHSQDASGYPDCRKDFIKSFEETANLGTRIGTQEGDVRIRSPLIEMTKADIIRRGTALGVDYSLTHSCYDPTDDGRACGECDSCLFRKRGFEEAGVPDPTRYI